MAVGLEQSLVIVLAVQLDQTRREIAKRRRGGQRAVDERATASLRRDLPADDHFAVAGVEDRLDGRDVFARPHEVARRARAKQQSDGFDEDRLAGARFARQDVQAGFELDLDFVDDREVLDAQVAQHGAPNLGIGVVGEPPAAQAFRPASAASSIVAYP